MTDMLQDRLGISAPGRTALACESQLRVAAATIRRAAAGEITAMTAVGVLGADDLSAFNNLVAAIAEEFDLEASVRLYVGSFSVRFIRRPHI